MKDTRLKSKSKLAEWYESQDNPFYNDLELSDSKSSREENEESRVTLERALYIL